MSLQICEPDHRLKGWSKWRWTDVQAEYPQVARTVRGYIRAGFGLQEIAKNQQFIAIELQRQSFLGDPNSDHCTTWLELKTLSFFDYRKPKHRLFISSYMQRIVNDGNLQTFKGRGQWR